MHHPTEADPDAEFTLAQRQPLCVLCLELDGVKALTWTRDLATSEDLLTTLTARLAQALGEDGTLAALESVTFAFLLHGIPDRERLCHLAWKLLDAAASPVTLGNIRFALRPWVGIARWPADGTTCAGLFRNARAAMHRARHQRSGYAFFEERTDIWDHDD
jgi:GGDEF domain-containing protein